MLSGWSEEVAASRSYNDCCVESFSPSLQASVNQPCLQKLVLQQQEPWVLPAARQVLASAVFDQTMSAVKGLLVGSAEAVQLGPESQAELCCPPLWNNWWAYHVLREYLE